MMHCPRNKGRGEQKRRAEQRVTYLKMHIIKIYERVLNKDITHEPPLLDLPQQRANAEQSN